MSDTYFAARRLQEFLAIVNDGLRNLQSGDGLGAFFDWAEEVPPQEVVSRFEASVAFRESNDLPPVGEPSFTAQVSKSGSKNTFLQMVQEMGIEAEFQNDVSEAVPADVPVAVPGLEDTIQSLVRKGFTVDQEALQALYPELASGEPVKHISEVSPTPWAQEDSIVLMKWKRAQEYVRAYFGG